LRWGWQAAPAIRAVPVLVCPNIVAPHRHIPHLEAACANPTRSTPSRYLFPHPALMFAVKPLGDDLLPLASAGRESGECGAVVRDGAIDPAVCDRLPGGPADLLVPRRVGKEIDDPLGERDMVP
jgi:hypothetical protein